MALQPGSVAAGCQVGASAHTGARYRWRTD